MKSILVFIKQKSDVGLPDIIRVYNKREEKLGSISYYRKWRKFVWEQELCVMMSSDCLQGVAEYMKRMSYNKKGE